MFVYAYIWIMCIRVRSHIFITTHVIILIRTSYMCHPRYTFKVGLNLRRYEVPTYTHFNPYNAPYRALPPDSISLLRLGSSTHGYHGCLLVGNPTFCPISLLVLTPPLPQLIILQAVSIIPRNNSARRAPLYFCLGSFQLTFWVFPISTYRQGKGLEHLGPLCQQEVSDCEYINHF